MKNPLLKYLIKANKEDVFHSSAYSKVKSGDTIGSASSESFATRQAIEQNRQLVKKYHDSLIASNTYNRHLAASSTNSASSSNPTNSSSSTKDTQATIASNRAAVAKKFVPIERPASSAPSSPSSLPPRRPNFPTPHR